MKTNNYDDRDNNNRRNNFRRKWGKAVLLTGFYLFANVVADFFMNQEVEFISSLLGAAFFGVFVAIGIFSSK